MQSAKAGDTEAGIGARIEAARASAFKLTIYHLPPGLRTLVAVTAAALEAFPGVAVDEIGDAATIGSALDALVAARPVPENHPLNVRYGLIFTDVGGERIMRAYKGRFASEGQIEDTPCDFEEPSLHEWLIARYPAARHG